MITGGTPVDWTPPYDGDARCNSPAIWTVSQLRNALASHWDPGGCHVCAQDLSASIPKQQISCFFLRCISTPVGKWVNRGQHLCRLEDTKQVSTTRFGRPAGAGIAAKAAPQAAGSLASSLSSGWTKCSAVVEKNMKKRYGHVIYGQWTHLQIIWNILK